MKYYDNNILCLEYDELVPDIMARRTYERQAAIRNDDNRCKIKIYGRGGGAGNGVLIEYESLPKRLKEKVLDKFGNPYNYIQCQGITGAVEYDLDAERFYLDAGVQAKDAIAKARAISLVKYVDGKLADKKALKQEFKTVDSFLQRIITIIQLSKLELPLSEKALVYAQDSILKRWKEKGYDCLIHAGAGNKNTAKISDEKSESALLEIIAHPNQYDDVLVAFFYNKWAGENGYKTICPATVGVWRRKREADIMIERYGNNAFNEKYIRQVKGLPPSRTGMLWESDDYNLNYYYNGPDGNLMRYVSYVVADSKYGLVLGKSYRPAKSPVWEMVKLAYIDAMYYVRDLVNDGNWYLPHELKADHWNKTTAFPYFQKIAKFVPPAHANKHRGYIEQLFGSVHAKRAEKLCAHNLLNYNGNNITARNSGVNMEVLHRNQNRRPNVGPEAEDQVEKFFYAMRNMPNITRENMNARSRQQLWLDNFNSLPSEQKRIINDEQFLIRFGFKHEPDNGKRNTITNRGIECQIKNVKYSYDLPNYAEYIYMIGKQVDIYFDPYDMSRILVTNDADIKFIARSATLSPRALNDAKPGSRAALNMVLSEKKLQVQNASKKSQRRIEITGGSYDAEAVMLGGFMPKEKRNLIESAADKMIMHNETETAEWQEKQDAYTDENYDLDKFFEND